MSDEQRSPLAPTPANSDPVDVMGDIILQGRMNVSGKAGLDPKNVIVEPRKLASNDGDRKTTRLAGPHSRQLAGASEPVPEAGADTDRMQIRLNKLVPATAAGART
jgi:hypothetical protein